MMPGSVSCARYIIGVTYSRPLLRPRWCTRTIGAPAKFPPTRPSFARNSAMVFAFQSSGSLMSNSSKALPDTATTRLAARQVSRRHRIRVIRATRVPGATIRSAGEERLQLGEEPARVLEVGDVPALGDARPRGTGNILRGRGGQRDEGSDTGGFGRGGAL